MTNVHAARINLQGRMASPYSAADGTQTLINDATVTLPIASRIKRLTTAGAVTGIIMPVGVEDGQVIDLLNISANSITFAVVATSRVADGASAIIAALTRMTLIWDVTSETWFHGN